MFDSAVLDVAVGLTFVYLLLSLLCTAANESLEAVLQFRARNLERGLGELLQDPDGSRRIVAAFYNHPLIDGLFRGDYGGTPAGVGDGGGGDSAQRPRRPDLPAYIPSRSFALAVLDLIRSGVGGPDTPAPTVLGQGTTAELRQAVLTSPLFAASPPLQRSLVTLIDDAGDDLVKVRLNLEAWYDASMDRVSGWYKRRAQFLSLAVGLALAVAANADTFDLARSLSQNKALRESLIKGAGDYEALARAQPPSQDGPPPVPTERWIATRVAEMRPLGLPVGWRREDVISPSYWGGRLPGWLVTTLAISLGAPFWFDLLNRFMIIRSTVKPHEKSRDQGPRD